MQASQGNTTVVFTTHKVSQARLADTIVIMAHGRVLEQGTHAELLKAKGAYWRLVAAGEGSDEAAAAALIDAAVLPTSASPASLARADDDSLSIAAKLDAALTENNAPPKPPPSSRIGSSTDRPNP